MKTKHILIGLLIMTMPMVSLAQIGGSIFDNVKMDSKDRKTLKGTYDYFSKEFTDFDGDTMVERCLKVMGDHAEKLALLQDEIEKTKECKKHKELLEYQALLLLSGGTKFFCPEELYSDPAQYGYEIAKYFQLSVLMDIEISIDEGYYNDSKEDLSNLGKIIEDVMEKEADINTFKEDMKELGKILQKFKFADEKFGNPYNLFFEGDIEHKILFILPEDEENTKEEWVDFINYFTYYLNPKEFMAKRATEINSMVESLPCD